MSRRRFFLGTALLLAAAPAALAAGAAPPAPAARVINEADRLVLSGNVPRQARPERQIGRTAPQLPMERMILHLQPRAGAQAAIVQLLADQQDPRSPQYHHWLTPEEFGARFGPADQDLQAVTGWLGAHGFTVDEVAKGRGWLNFSGTVAQVETAFATEIHDYQVDGAVRHANSVDPSIPKGLADVVGGVVSLNSFPWKAHISSVKPVPQTAPRFNEGGDTFFLAPGDFATIYDVNTPYSKGVNGSGQSIAVVGRTDIRLSDVQLFRSQFGLPANDPVFIHNGKDPGTESGDELESDLDTEWAGAVAPRATVKLVISATTNATDGVLLSAEYIVDQNVAPIMTVSYGLCESDMGASGVTFYDNLLAQASAEGISAFSAAGDSGAADCDDPSSASGTKRAVDNPCSSPNNTCVGGSEFLDTANPSAYWGAQDPTTGASALAYIPEMAWNESGTVAGDGNEDLWSTGGGVSSSFAKPSWQSAPGVPADGKRDVPDVALSAAAHDGYLVVQHALLGAVSGTSCTAPTFAGLTALVVQQQGARQGNINSTLYKLATTQYDGGSNIVFHDVKKGNNNVPGVTGYVAGTAYDTVTGLGSVDAAQLLAQWPGSPGGGGGGQPVPCVPGATTLCLEGGRFAVTATYNAGSSGSGTAQVVDLTDDTGYLWFFAASNVEAVVKVLNGCALGGHYWFFAGGLTNVNVVITVTDSQTGAMRTYTNPQSTAFQPIQDTAAFSTCP